MAYRLPSERVELEIAEGLLIEVERLQPGSLHQAVLGALAAVFQKSDDPERLERLRAAFVAAAQPTWAILDPLGVVHATPEGMSRLPVPMQLQMVMSWAETAVPKTTAADELLPAGPVRDEVNRRLRSVKKAA